MTSSTAAVFKRLVEPGHVYDEQDWTDPIELAERKLWYSIAKTKQERAAWAWMESEKPSFSLVCLNPTMIAGGPARQPTLNASLENVRDLCNGSSATVSNFNMPWVHLLDVVDAHVAAAENDAANGRYLILASWAPLTQSAQAIKDLNFAGLTVPTQLAEGQIPVAVALFDSSRVEKELLGRKLRNLSECMGDAVTALIKWGHL